MSHQVPVNEIDSVSFNPIPTIYKNNAVKIEGRLRDYVTGCDSLTLCKSSIPEELLPACGDNIATLECDDILPYGFIGKVENIVRGEDVINIECSKVSLLMCSTACRLKSVHPRMKTLLLHEAELASYCQFKAIWYSFY